VPGAVNERWLRGLLNGRDPVEGVAAVRPDHPYLFYGPDALIGRNGTLAGVFRLRGEEVRQPALLWSRFVAARLALPRHMWTVLIVGEDAPSAVLDVAGWNFDVVVNQDPREVRSLLQAQPRNPRLGEIPPGLQKWCFSRSKALLDMSLRATRTTRRQPHEQSVVEARRYVVAAGFEIETSKSWKQKKKPRPDDSATQAVLLDTSERDWNLARDRLRRFCRSMLGGAFDLDNGVPYPRPPALGIALGHTISGTPDPTRHCLRAAAFHGCVVTHPEDVQQVRSLQSKRLEWIWHWGQS